MHTKAVLQLRGRLADGRTRPSDRRFGPSGRRAAATGAAPAAARSGSRYGRHAEPPVQAADRPAVGGRRRAGRDARRPSPASPTATRGSHRLVGGAQPAGDARHHDDPAPGDRAGEGDRPRQRRRGPGRRARRPGRRRGARADQAVGVGRTPRRIRGRVDRPLGQAPVAAPLAGRPGHSRGEGRQPPSSGDDEQARRAGSAWATIGAACSARPLGDARARSRRCGRAGFPPGRAQAPTPYTAPQRPFVGDCACRHRTPGPRPGR